jgi:hypothetical protein
MAPHAFADLSISLIFGSLWNEGIRGLWYNDKISSVWTGSRFCPGHIDKEYYFLGWLNFLFKIELDREHFYLKGVPKFIHYLFVDKNELCCT